MDVAKTLCRIAKVNRDLWDLPAILLAATIVLVTLEKLAP